MTCAESASKARLVPPVLLLMLMLLPIVHSSSGDKTLEYCFPNAFNATCDADSVIVMESARYGRMRTSGCLTADVHVGCWSDVLGEVDKRCSGRHHCRIRIPDTVLQSIQPCPKDMLGSLVARYSCVKVEKSAHSACEYPLSMPVAATPGYLASIVTEELGYGSTRCPWVIELEQGQRINLTLLDFGVGSSFADTGSMCHVYAMIQEVGMASDVTICGGAARQRNVYISETNRIEVRLMSFKKEETPTYYLLQYDAIGCTDPPVPAGATLQRTGDKAVIACNYTTQAWHIVCHGNRWFGKLNNCTVAWLPPKSETLSSSTTSFPYGLLIAVVMGIVLGVLVGIALLSLLMLCHRRRKRAGAAGRAVQESHYGAQTELSPNESFLQHQEAIKNYHPEGHYGYTHMCGVRVTHPYTQEPITVLASTEVGEPQGGDGVKRTPSRQHSYEKTGYWKDSEPCACVLSSKCELPAPVYHDFDPSVLEALRRATEERSGADF